MKKILLIATIALCFSCKKDTGYAVNGTIDESFNGKKVYISHLEENNATTKIDSAVISEGKFKLDPQDTDRQYLAFLNIEGISLNLPFIAENEAISMTVYKDSLRQSVIKGGAQNKVFKDYLNHLTETNKRISEGTQKAREAMSQGDTATISSIKMVREEIIENDKLYKINVAKEHKTSLVAVLALTDLTNLKTISSIEAKEMFDELSDEVKTSSLGKNLSKMLSARSATDIGAKAPDFSGPTPNGETLSLKDALGKVTILDFWASWCKPCRIENPNVVRVYEKYHDKGLNIVGISLDKSTQKESWLKAIEDDNLTWQHVSNLQFWQEPIAQQYGVRSIPATFILDENGVIIAKNLRGKDLEDKMAELLN